MNDGSQARKLPARVLIADDHELAREALLRVLSMEPDFEVVGVAGDGDAAVELAIELEPDIVILDVRMPGVDGHAAASQIAVAVPGARVVMLSSYGQGSQVRDALSSGATAYLLKGATKQQVLDALRHALEGQVTVSPELAGAMFRSRSTLSERETQVLQFIAEGLTNEQISREMCVSVNTVKTHVGHLLDKLGATDRASAVARGISLGVIDASDVFG